MNMVAFKNRSAVWDMIIKYMDQTQAIREMTSSAYSLSSYQVYRNLYRTVIKYYCRDGSTFVTGKEILGTGGHSSYVGWFVKCDMYHLSKWVQEGILRTLAGL